MAGAIIAAVIGGIVAAVSWIWITKIAFRESTNQGLLCLFVPFYEIYYVIKRWSGLKKPFFIGLAGVGILIIGIVSSVGGFRPVISGFMEAAAANECGAAYAFWAPRAATEEEMCELIERHYDDLFAGYEGLSIRSVSTSSEAGITRGEVSGAISYTDGRRLPFEASLVKVNDVWKITDIGIGF